MKSRFNKRISKRKMERNISLEEFKKIYIKYLNNELERNYLLNLLGIDYCGDCKQFIDQIEIKEGTFGCPLCKTDNNIETYYSEDEE